MGPGVLRGSPLVSCVYRLTAIVKDVTGGYTFKYHPEGPGGRELEVDFTPPFRCVHPSGVGVGPCVAGLLTTSVAPHQPAASP